MPIEIFNCEQGSDAWHACRAGIPTASNFATVMANGKGGGPSLTRAKYMRRLAAEIMTGEACRDEYTNAAMERGKVMEAEARDWYSLVHAPDDMTEVGFIRNGDKGCSPDRLIGANGGLEIKTKQGDLQVEVLLRDKAQRQITPDKGFLPPEHVAQVQGSMWVCEREHWVFLSYWPKLTPLVTKVYRDEAYIMQLAAEVKRFNDELHDMVEALRTL